MSILPLATYSPSIRAAVTLMRVGAPASMSGDSIAAFRFTPARSMFWLMASDMPSQPLWQVAHIRSGRAGSVSDVHVPTPSTPSNVTSWAKMLAGLELVSDSVTGVDAAAWPATMNRLMNSNAMTARIRMGCLPFAAITHLPSEGVGTSDHRRL